MPQTQDEPAAELTVYADGPLILRGSFRMTDQDGNVIEAGRPAVALCRCGRSAIKPFCDSTHKAVGFRASCDRQSDD